MAVNIKQRLLTAGVLIPIVIFCANSRIGWIFLNLGNDNINQRIRIPSLSYSRVFADNGEHFKVFIHQSEK